MAKGFGTSSKNRPLGYILILVPDANVYACDDPLWDQENFGGITNALNMAKVLRKIYSAKSNIGPYIDWLANVYYEGKKDVIEVEIAELHKDKKGDLKTKSIKFMTLIKESEFLDS